MSSEVPEGSALTAPSLKYASNIRLSGVIGRGASSLVYSGYSESDDLKPSGPDAAVKVFLPTDGRLWGAELFASEARLLRSVDHPGIVKVLNYGETDEGFPFLAYSLIAGQSLELALEQRPLTRRQACEITAALAEALEYAHEQMVVHRDIKPANIMLESDLSPVLIDFSVALTEDTYGENLKTANAGTPSYTSPEQARGMGHLVDGRSDIFSLGAVFYEMLTGVPPFRANDRKECLRRIREHDPRPLRQIDPRIPVEAEKICLTCLSKRQEARYSSAGDLARALRQLLECWDQKPAAETSTTVVPKGLLSYEHGDAAWFVKMLPGPRIGDLPESIRFWKERIEDPSSSIAVGVIYGCSGSGKTSFLRAGLLPLLSESVSIVYTSFSSDKGEQRLLEEMREKCAYLPRDLDLVDSIARISKGGVLTAGRKLLVVIDQFEHWLQRYFSADETDTSLPQLLSTFDGEHVQCLLVVRDDFWTELSRLFLDLDLSLATGVNTQLVDTFDQEHALQVLEAFGRAHRRFPESGELGSHQQEFLRGAVTLLNYRHRVRPVDLALLTEMLKDRVWEPATLDETGGLDGLGERFLGEVRGRLARDARFSSVADAFQKVLDNLLPQAGGKLKGAAKSATELAETCGTEVEPMREMLAYLDREERVLAPVEGKRGWQLSHDVLVGSVRNWLQRDRLRTSRGRIAQRRKNLADAWHGSGKQREFLPSWFVWAQFLCVPAAEDSERELMTAARRMHLPIIATVMAALCTIGFITWKVDRDNGARAASDLIAGVRNPVKLEQALEAINAHSPALLATHLKDEDRNLGTLLGLTAVEAIQPTLAEVLALASPEHLPLIARTLTPDIIAARTLAEDAQQSRSMRLSAAAILALWERDELWWEVRGGTEMSKLLAECNPVVVRDWAPHFRSRSRWLLPNLNSLLENSTSPNAGLAITVLLYEFSKDNAGALADLVSQAQPSQFQYLADSISRELFLPEARRSLAAPPLLETVRERSRLALMCVALGDLQPFRSIASQGATDPDLRSAVIHRWKEYGLPPEPLIAELTAEDVAPDTSHACLLALGEYDEIPAAQETVTRLAQSADNTGTLSAARWLLTKWDKEIPKPVPSPTAQWLVSAQGHIFHRIPDSDYALSTCEVTEREFAQFRESRPSDSTTPVTEVTWQEARAYCNWLTSLEPDLMPCYVADADDPKKLEPAPDWQERSGYRLPTESEWESACEAGTKTSRSFGDDVALVVKYVWIAENSEGNIMPTGELIPNRWGFFDMLGNANEMCDDDAGRRLVRGYNFLTLNRRAIRADQTFREQNLPSHLARGFRLARTFKVH